MSLGTSRKLDAKENGMTGGGGGDVGCICPIGCKIGLPIEITNPGFAPRLTCTNNEKERKCTEVSLYIHPECLEAWEERLTFLIQHGHGNRGRGSVWTDKQRQQNLWNKKGYEVIFKQCRCPCGGYLRKDIDYCPPIQNRDEGAKKKKSKSQLPKLGTGNLNYSNNCSASDFVDKCIRPMQTRIREETPSPSPTWRHPVPRPPPPAVFDTAAFPGLKDEGVTYLNGSWAAPEQQSGAWARVAGVRQPDCIRTQEQLLDVLKELVVSKGRLGPTDQELTQAFDRLDIYLATDVCASDGVLGWVRSLGPSTGLLVQGDYIVIRPPDYYYPLPEMTSKEPSLSEEYDTPQESSSEYLECEEASLEKHCQFQYMRESFSFCWKYSAALQRLEDLLI